MQFITYPRTGVNFMVEAIKMQTGLEIKYSHIEFFEGDDLLINIVRDPSESIASWISLAIFREDSVIKNNDLNSVVNLRAKNKYINMYNFLLSNNNTIFINYKDFLNIDELMIKLCDILNINIVNKLDIDKVNDIVLEKSNRLKAKYLLTSKKEEQYIEIYNKIKKIDLTECYDLYNQALDKCIKI